MLRASSGQSPGSTQISGGSINGTPVGAATPSTGKFTTLESTSTLVVGTTITSYNGIPTVDGGVAAIYGRYNAVTQAANIGATTVYAVPANGAGMYRMSAYAVVTQAATTSSTLPNVQALWTDSDSSTPLLASQVTSTNTANAPGAFGNGDIILYAKASTNIQFQTANYASSGATPMNYAVHIKLEYLG